MVQCAKLCKEKLQGFIVCRGHAKDKKQLHALQQDSDSSQYLDEEDSEEAELDCVQLSELLAHKEKTAQVYTS